MTIAKITKVFLLVSTVLLMNVTGNGTLTFVNNCGYDITVLQTWCGGASQTVPLYPNGQDQITLTDESGLVCKYFAISGYGPDGNNNWEGQSAQLTISGDSVDESILMYDVESQPNIFMSMQVSCQNGGCSGFTCNQYPCSDETDVNNNGLGYSTSDVSRILAENFDMTVAFCY